MKETLSVLALFGGTFAFIALGLHFGFKWIDKSCTTARSTPASRSFGGPIIEDENMPLKFTSREKRDELAERLINLSQYMQSSFDQGQHGTIGVTDQMIGDLKTAACVIALADIQEPNQLTQKEIFDLQQYPNAKPQ